MLVIRKDQIEAFEEAAIENFVVEMADHCKEFSPHLCKTLNDEQLRAAIRKGMARADEYDFTLQGPVRFYIEMMILFGSRFDTDPQYPWAAEILSQKEELSEMQRAEALFTKTNEYLAAVDGENNVHTLKALDDLAKLYKQGITFRHESLASDLLRLMKETHPRKFEETNVERLSQLIADGKKKGQALYQFREARSLGLMAVLMYAFGHGFDSDPLLPWISRTLTSDDQIDPDAKAKDLERRAMIWVDAVLRNAKEDS